MPVAMIIAVLAVLAGVFFAATGRGGQLAYESADHVPLDLGPVSAADIALLRPPTALWGYNMQVTDEALDQIARAVRDRDVTIAYLQQQLATRTPRDPGALRAAGVSADAAALAALAVPARSEAAPAVRFPERPPEPLAPPGILVARPHDVTQPSGVAQSSDATQVFGPIQPSGDATVPTGFVPGSYDIQGPQGAYDTHDWWAEQEEAAREEAQRQADAQKAPEDSTPQDSAPEDSAPEDSAPEDSAPQDSTPEDSRPEDSALEAFFTPAAQADPPFGPTDTQPNLTMPAHPPTPDDAEEQAW